MADFDSLDALNEAVNDFLQNESLSEETFKGALGPRGSGNIVLGQINPSVGDLQGNAKKIFRYLHLAEIMEADMIIFPELALMGYPIRDVIVRHPFLVKENLKWLQALAQCTGKTRAAIGFIEPNNNNHAHHPKGKPFYNAMALLGEGAVEGIVRKSLLPNYNEFNDVRTFEPSRTIGMTSSGMTSTSTQDVKGLSRVHGHLYGFSICEDTWNDELFFHRPLYSKDPIEALMRLGPEVLINISASPTRSRKERMKQELLSHVAKRHEIPYVYVNQVGAVDECSFDGASRLYDGGGRLVARAKAFAEQFFIVNPFLASEPCSSSSIYPLPVGLEEELAIEGSKRFDAYHISDLGRTHETLVQGIRDFFQKTGFQRAVLGLSGGLDSSVTAVLLVDALGAENVLGVGMPSQWTLSESREDAKILASNLGIGWLEMPIGTITDAFMNQLESGVQDMVPRWGAPHPASFAQDNVQAMSRATILRLLGNEYNALPIATSDKSEFYLGYTTVNGDMSGALAPLADIPKTKVRALAHWLNEHRVTPALIPENIITKPSGADLAINPETGKLLTAEEALMPYEFADEVIWRIEALHQSKAEMIDAPFQWEEKHLLPPEQKRAWLDKFYWRMAHSVFKWWISPPAIIVEGNGSITKTDYHHPITANRIDWDGKTVAKMLELLKEK